MIHIATSLRLHLFKSRMSLKIFKHWMMKLSTVSVWSVSSYRQLQFCRKFIVAIVVLAKDSISLVAPRVGTNRLSNRLHTICKLAMLDPGFWGCCCCEGWGLANGGPAPGSGGGVGPPAPATPPYAPTSMLWGWWGPLGPPIWTWDMNWGRGWGWYCWWYCCCCCIRCCCWLTLVDPVLLLGPKNIHIWSHGTANCVW